MTDLGSLGGNFSYARNINEAGQIIGRAATAGGQYHAFLAMVTKVDQTITVNTNAPASAINGSNFTVAATASSGLPVSYSSSGACTNVGADFTMTSATGTCTVMYDQAGDASYNPAPQIMEIVTAQPLPTIRYVAISGSNTGNNDCFNSASPCATITYAISQAFAGNTIEIAAGTYTEAGITVDKNLTITGAGASSTIVQAATAPDTASDRVFYINSGVTATIEDLTIENGKVIGFGGGVYNLGILTLDGVTVSGNFATNGGGLNNFGGPVVLNNSTVSGNSASTSGGGLFNNSTVTLNNSIVSGNSGVNGGGLFNNGAVTLNDSTVSGNSATYGGGIYAGGTVTLNNSTVSANSGGSGGGLFNNSTVTLNNSTVSGNSGGNGGGLSNNGTVTLNNSTFSNNSASFTGGGLSGGGAVNLKNSIVAGN